MTPIMRSSVPIPSKIPNSKNGGKKSPIRIKAPPESKMSGFINSEPTKINSSARTRPLEILPSWGS